MIDVHMAYCDKTIYYSFQWDFDGLGEVLAANKQAENYECFC